MSLLEQKVIDSIMITDSSTVDKNRSLEKVTSMQSMQSTELPVTEHQSRSKQLHVALYERRIAKFSQKYGLHLNSFLKKKRRETSHKSM